MWIEDYNKRYEQRLCKIRMTTYSCTLNNWVQYWYTIDSNQFFHILITDYDIYSINHTQNMYCVVFCRCYVNHDRLCFIWDRKHSLINGTPRIFYVAKLDYKLETSLNIDKPGKYLKYSIKKLCAYFAGKN